MADIDDIVADALERSTAKQEERQRAVAAWTASRAKASDERASAAGFLDASRRGRQRAPARAVLDAIAAARPGESWPFVLSAEFAESTGDHRAALRAGQALRAHFPDLDVGCKVTLTALIKLDRVGEAATLLSETAARSAGSEWFVGATVMLAQRRREWPAMLEAAEHYRTLAPREPEGFFWKAVALGKLSRFDEAEAEALAALDSFPGKPGVWKNAAGVAEACGKPELAMSRWAEIRERFAKSKAGYVGALNLVQKTKRLDLLGTLLAEALEKFPKDRRVLTLAAELAGPANWQEADKHWQKLVRMFPDNRDFALSAALAPTGPRRGRRKRLAEVVLRLDAVHTRFPDFMGAYVAHLDALREARKLDEAEAKSAAWCERFPDDLELAFARVAVAEDQERFEVAASLLDDLRRRLPPNPAIEAAYVRVLSRAGRHEDAERACDTALTAHKDDRKILSEYARLASRRGDWAGAMSRWLEAQQKRPGDAKIAQELNLVRLQLAEQGEADGPEPAATDTLFAHFESLGGTVTGCEFGMVQSQHGAKGVGLLRWTKSNIATLTQALEQGFDGVGEEENTVLSTVRMSADREEYVTSDKRFDMSSNTFIRITDAPADKMFQQTCRRLRFLRTKLIEDLTAAEKIFVFKVAEPTGEAVLRRLFAAVRHYGHATLLCVLAADADNPKGSMRWLEPGLLLGYIGHFLKSADGGLRGIDIATWKVLAAEAVVRRDAAASAPEAAAA